jgi:hypothetical protein
MLSVVNILSLFNRARFVDGLRLFSLKIDVAIGRKPIRVPLNTDRRARVKEECSSRNNIR